MEVGLSLGSNLGDRLRNLQVTKTELAAIPGVEVVDRSPVYETEPVDVAPAFKSRRFLNAMVIVETGKSPEELLHYLRIIETRLGRRRTADRNAPRTIDIDIIYVGEMRRRSGPLILPHPRWKERRFVVQPLADVRPELVLPDEARPVSKVLRSLPPSPKAVLFSPDW
jgi:2-amino-4-hydroxy-6-hydroxymethyldihydropteridine diphosphokinase